jgi:hypothetical protein
VGTVTVLSSANAGEIKVTARAVVKRRVFIINYPLSASFSK